MRYFLLIQRPAILPADQIRNIILFVTEHSHNCPQWNSKRPDWISSLNTEAYRSKLFDENIYISYLSNRDSLDRIGIFLRLDKFQQHYNFTLRDKAIGYDNLIFDFPLWASFEFKNESMTVHGLDDHDLTIARIAGLKQ